MDMWMDVDTALSEVPVNLMPLLDDTDFKTRETAVAYNAAGMDLVWNFVTPGGAFTQTAVTPTTAGSYDWTHQGDGMYSIEIPASGGASINNDTEGFGWFSGVATGVLPWRGPVIGFRAAALNDALIENAWSTTRGLAGTALPNAAADAAGGLPISDAGGLDLDAQVVTKINDILTDTGTTLDARIPAALVSGRMDASVGAMAANVMTAAAAAADLTTELQSGLATSSALSSLQSDVTTLLGRITSTLFTGITSLAEWLGLLAGKQTGNTTARTEIRATGAGSGTYDETTDALQALRDRGDAAWTTATGFSTLDAAGVRTAVGLASANLDTQLDALPTAAENADAVWDEVLSGHLTGGTTGAGLNAAGSAGDPWSTALPGAYSAGSAGKIVGDNLNATVSSRLATSGYTAPLDAAGTRSAVGLASANLDTQLTAIDDAVDTEVASVLAAVDTEVAAIKAKTDNLPIDPADASDIAALLATITGYLDTEIAAILAAVDTEVGAIKTVTDQLVAAQSEPSAVPAANATPLAKIAWLAALARNKITQSATTQTLLADDGSTTVATSTHSDDGSVHTKGEWA